MIRKYFITNQELKKDKIAWRSHEVTRIEAFSDAVFAFAVSLLVISLEVPKNSTELLLSLWGLVPFFFCFLIIFWIWSTQYKFFRRYGLHDRPTLVMNAILLFITLGFVYPLKFLFSSMFLPNAYKIIGTDGVTLLKFYYAGFLVIEILFALMHVNAWFKRDAISLTPQERFETTTIIWSYVIVALVCSSAISLLYLPGLTGFSWLVFPLLGVIMPIFDRKRDKVFKQKFGITPAVLARNPEV